MKDFLIFGTSVKVGERLQPGVALWLERSRHKAYLVHFEHGLEQVLATVIKGGFKLVVAWVVMETSIMQMSLTYLDWASLVAHHELLEGEEAKIPTITFFISYEL